MKLNLFFILVIVCSFVAQTQQSRSKSQLKFLEDNEIVKKLKKLDTDQSLIKFVEIVEKFIEYYDLVSADIYESENKNKSIKVSFDNAKYILDKKPLLYTKVAEENRNEVRKIIDNSISYLSDLIQEIKQSIWDHNSDLYGVSNLEVYTPNFTEPDISEFKKTGIDEPIPYTPIKPVPIKPIDPKPIVDPKPVKPNVDPKPIKPVDPKPTIDPKPVDPKPIVNPKPIKPVDPKPFVDPKPIKPNPITPNDPKPINPIPDNYEPYMPGILKPKILSDYFPNLPIDLDRLNKTDIENIKIRFKKLRLVLLMRIESDIRYIEDYQKKIENHKEKDEMLEFYEKRLIVFKQYLKENVIRTEEVIKRDGDLAIDYKYQY